MSEANSQPSTISSDQVTSPSSDNSTVNIGTDITLIISPESENNEINGMESNEEISHMDRYGFVLNSSSFFHQSKEISNEQEVQRRKEKETERERKWLKMMKKWDFTIKRRLAKLKRRIRKGIPDGFRGVMWYKILQLAAYSEDDIKKHLTFPERYPNLYNITQIPIDKIPIQTIEEIERDVDRTFPNHVFFQTNGGPGQESLRKVLRWYAAIDPEVGYCQGMGFIAGLLLTYMPEETAFYCFAALLNHTKGPLRQLYLPGLIDAKKKIYVFGALLNQYMQPLAQHFEKQNIIPTMFAAEWILCIFCRGFSFDLVTRVIDVYSYEGFKIVYRIALALLKTIEVKLLKQNFEEILATLRGISSDVDAQEVFTVAWTIPVKTNDIHLYENMYLETGDAF